MYIIHYESAVDQNVIHEVYAADGKEAEVLMTILNDSGHTAWLYDIDHLRKEI